MRLAKEVFIIALAFIAFRLFSGDRTEPEGVVRNVKYDISKLIKKSDFIFIGDIREKSISPKIYKIKEGEYGVKNYPLNLKIYTINAKEVLKGNAKEIGKSLVIVDTTYKSSMAHLTPIIDGKQYVFILRRTKPSNEGLEKHFNYYELLEGWHGMIALEKGCASKGAVRMIKEIYGIDVLESPESFIKALTLLITGKKPDKKSGKTVEEFYSKIARKQNQ